MPAYLLADLDGRLKQADPVFALTHECTSFDHARHKFAMFNAEDFRAIASYLAYKLQSDTITDFEKTRVREALQNYWTI